MARTRSASALPSRQRSPSEPVCSPCPPLRTSRRLRMPFRDRQFESPVTRCGGRAPPAGGARRSGCPTPRSPTTRPSPHVDQALPDPPISYPSSLAAPRSGSARPPHLLPPAPRRSPIRLCPTPRSPPTPPSQHVDRALPDSPISYRSSLAARRSGSGHGDRDGAARDLLARGVRLLAGGGRHRDVHGEHLTGHQLRMRLDGEDDLLIALHRQPDTVRHIQTGGTAGRLDHPDHVTSDALA